VELWPDGAAPIGEPKLTVRARNLFLVHPPARVAAMDRRLVQIKRLVAAGLYDFTMKADIECATDGLTRADVVESILSAQFVRVKNSRSPWRQGRREKMYIIDSFNFDGVPIYSKGVLRRLTGHDSQFYILISGKRSIRSD